MAKKSSNLKEQELDRALDDALKTNKKFAMWLLKKTKFSKLNAYYFWSRSDNPWGRFRFEINNPETNVPETIERDSETDVLVVFETADNKRFALHIENKLTNGHFTKYQPDMYEMRATRWLNNPKFKNYTEFETVLIAPFIFNNRLNRYPNRTVNRIPFNS